MEDFLLRKKKRSPEAIRALRLLRAAIECDPAHAKAHGLELNYKWYWEHCIRDAMKKILEYVPAIDYAKLTREYTLRLESKRLGVQSTALRSMFKARARE